MWLIADLALIAVTAFAAFAYFDAISLGTPVVGTAGVVYSMSLPLSVLAELAQSAKVKLVP